ncbi:histidine kinase [Salmonella enterica subsp. arizonae]|uniref:Histidine kinase n=1 Tax=Salmonella enterica subsp. arizonae TaxID=59203 RepID=A0A379T4D2_SALER|nr:histidine kinase [Salmonella enterica subsp. arizonae]
MPVSEYNHILVAVLFAVAIFPSYTAFNMAGRFAGSARMSAWIWLIGGGFALGVCILAMHFVGMLVMDHAINIRFDPFLTGFSMPIALDSPLFALWLISAEKLRLPPFTAGRAGDEAGHQRNALYRDGGAAIRLSYRLE